MPIGAYDTHTLQGVVRKLRQPRMYFLDLLFTSQVNFDDEFIDFDIVDEGRRIAPFVSPNVQGRVMKEKGFETRRFKPAYLKPKNIVDPSKPLKRMPGEAIGGSMSAEQRYNAHVANLLNVQRMSIMRRWELMAASAVLNGSVTVKGEDYPEVTVDFQRPSNLTVTPATAWDQAGATIIEDLDDWTRLVQEESGRTVVRITMGTSVWPVFSQNEAVKELLDTRRGSTSTMELGPGNGDSAQYKGTLGASLEVWVYNDIYEDDAGAKQNIMPADAVVLTCADIDGTRAFGAIMDARAGYQALDIFPKMWINEDPSVTYLMNQSAPLMIPGMPEATLRANVLTP